MLETWFFSSKQTVCNQSFLSHCLKLPVVIFALKIIRKILCQKNVLPEMLNKLLLYCYRPSIADQVHIGYFSQDRSSQTEVSEIAQLKEMTEVLQNLVRVSYVNSHSS